MLLAAGKEPEAAATEAGGVPAGLVYSSDREPGFTRVRRGQGFSYLDTKRRTIKDPGQLARIRKLAVPPAYVSVWICASANGHLQATGIDARGRKQYRYHERWREERDSGKFDRLLDFAQVLPRLRRQAAKDLQAGEHPRKLILATIVRLLDTTLVRVGNDQYAKENGSFGLTTLRNRHARIEGNKLKLSFRGKSGIRQEVEVHDPRVLKVVRRCLHLPGQELFQYRDEGGTVHAVSSSDVNEYLHEVCGERFTAKDFRTWHGTVLALDTLRRLSATGERFTLKQLLAEVSCSLGNTPAVCRKAYIHPDVLTLGIRLIAKPDFPVDWTSSRAIRGLSAAEQRLMAYLERLHELAGS
jgi:DNA topoisomerase I